MCKASSPWLLLKPLPAFALLSRVLSSANAQPVAGNKATRYLVTTDHVKPEKMVKWRFNQQQ